MNFLLSYKETDQKKTHSQTSIHCIARFPFVGWIVLISGLTCINADETEKIYLKGWIKW